MATDNEKISRAVDETLKEIEKSAPEEFAKLNTNQELKDAIIKEARKSAKEEVLREQFTLER